MSAVFPLCNFVLLDAYSVDTASTLRPAALKCALWLACVAVTTSGYQFGASPRLAARRRSALVVLQEQPETDAADENAMEPEGGWGVDNLMEMMETAESEAAPAAAPAQPAAPPVEESSYLATEKAKYAGASGASAGDGDGDTRLAVPSFFGKREEEKPGAARGKEGLNEQGYDPYDPSAIDSSNLDTKPVFIALALATVAIGALSVSNTAPPPPMT